MEVVVVGVVLHVTMGGVGVVMRVEGGVSVWWAEIVTSGQNLTIQDSLKSGWGSSKTCGVGVCV